MVQILIRTKQEVHCRSVVHFCIMKSMETEIKQINLELHRLYKVFYSKSTPPLVQRKVGCKIIALKNKLKMIIKKTKDVPHPSKENKNYV